MRSLQIKFLPIRNSGGGGGGEGGFIVIFILIKEFNIPFKFDSISSDLFDGSESQHAYQIECAY